MSDDPVYDKSRKLLEKLEQKAAHEEYLAKLQRIEALMDLNPDRESPEGEELEKLVDEVHTYEGEHFPITVNERIEALRRKIKGLSDQLVGLRRAVRHAEARVDAYERENKTLRLGLEHALETLELQAHPNRAWQRILAKILSPTKKSSPVNDKGGKN